MAARVLLAKYELDHYAEQLGKARGDYAGIVGAMHPDALRQIMAKVSDAVDDRLGQVAYDNLFWHRLVKDVAQTTIQSVGWNVGTVRVLFGGLKDVQRVFKPESLVGPLDRAGNVSQAEFRRVTGRLSYVIALATFVAAAGALTTYLMTGTRPRDMKDYFFPRTGRKNPDGSEERVSYPSYMKDAYAFVSHPIQTVSHKMHPTIGIIHELLANEDYYGRQIYNPDDPWWQAGEQIGKYMAKAFLPYAVGNQQRVKESGGGLGAQAAPFFGVTPAPAAIDWTPLEHFLHDHARLKSGTLTPEQGDLVDRKRAARAAIRRGEAVDPESLSGDQLREIRKQLRVDPQVQQFKSLAFAEKLRAYELASPEERERYRMRQQIMKARMLGAMKKLAPPERADAESRLARMFQ